METKLDNLQTTELTDQELAKVKTDLNFIDVLTKKGKELGCRVIIHGGYAVEGALGRITRPHNDIDIQIHSNQDSQIIERLIADVEKDPNFQKLTLKDKGRNMFTHNFFANGEVLGADIYYVQVKGDPFAEEKEVIKQDGTISTKHGYGTQTYTLEGVTFEGINPTSELADKIYKREYKKDPVKPNHTQDIENLKLITDPQEVEANVQEFVKR